MERVVRRQLDVAAAEHRRREVERLVPQPRHQRQIAGHVGHDVGPRLDHQVAVPLGEGPLEEQRHVVDFENDALS